MIVVLNMDGKRFGGGLLAGLLLALALVLGPALASGSLGAVGGFSPGVIKEMATTATATEAATTSAPAYSVVGNPPPNSTATSTATSQTATSTTSQSSTQTPEPLFAADLSPPPSADKLSNLPTEPPLLAILVLIPVLVALLAGGLLYRASKPRFSSKDED